jgi:hypothetical protein
VIDIENEVFNTVSTALKAQFPGIFFSGEKILVPPSFPCASLIEADNATHDRTLDSMTAENHADVMYQAEGFSNLVCGKKTQCKAIMAVIDNEMLGMGFVRIGSGPQEMPNADITKYRMLSRYRAVVSKDLMVYHR